MTIPLSIILNFAEDYRKIIANAKDELTLTRSCTDFNAIMQNVQEKPEELKIFEHGKCMSMFLFLLHRSMCRHR